MKSLIILSIIIFSSQYVINENEIFNLKQKAPFTVYNYEENPFKSYSESELKNLFQSNIPEKKTFLKKFPFLSKKNDLPESYDIREKWPSCIQRIWENPRCGSVTLPSVTAFSNRVCIGTLGKMTTQLSLQQIISCDPSSPKCETGGLAFTAWQFFKSNGVVDSLCYPFEGKESDCDNKCKNGDEWKVYKASNIYSLNNIDDIKNDLFNYGYVEATFTVYSDFINYQRGIYQHTTGSLMGNHSVVIVGWGVQNGIRYWICQNSWGRSWGEDGYFRIKMGEYGIDSNAYAGIYEK